MNLSVAVLFSRPDELRRVIANVERQQRKPDHVIFVEAPNVIDKAPRTGGDWFSGPITVVPARAAHSGDSRNAALEVLRKEKGAVVSFFDDDDYYGPGYLAEAEQALEEHPSVCAVGKRGNFVIYKDEMLFLFRDSLCNRRDQRALIGPTLTIRVDQAIPFRSVYGDDFYWCYDMYNKHGGRFWTTSRNHYAYRRHGKNYTGDWYPELVIWHGGKGSYLGRPDYRIVDGEVALPPGMPVTPNTRFNPEAA